MRVTCNSKSERSVTEWFEQWFGEEYLELYPHRDEEDARLAIDLITRVVSVRGKRVLDLACGTGRHASELTSRGATVVGLDLSRLLLGRASVQTPPLLGLLRADMRHLPIRNGSFDIVVNLFTSFGYFSHDSQHQAVLAGAASALVRRGTFVVDYFNSEWLQEKLVADEVSQLGSRAVAIKRRVTEDARFVEKEMHLLDDGRKFVERVRLFSPTELEEMLHAAQLEVQERFGDYAGNPLSATTPRAILIAERR